MADNQGTDLTLLQPNNYVQSAMASGLPSRDASNEPNFQHQAQQNLPPHAQHFSQYNMSLYAEARAFSSDSGNSVMQRHSNIADTVNAMDSLDLRNNVDMGQNRTFPTAGPPSIGANRFIPHNLSTPSMNSNLYSTHFSIPEFIPNRSSYSGCMPPPVIQQNPNSEVYAVSGMQQHFDSASESSMLSYMPDNQMSSSIIGQLNDSQVPVPAVLATPHLQIHSSNCFNASTPLRIGHGYEAPGTALPPSFAEHSVESFASNSAAPLHSSSLSHSSIGFNASSNTYQPEASLVQPVAQENGGTTYFYTQNQAMQTLPAAVVPSFDVFPGPHPSVEYVTLKANAPSFFISSELRQALQEKHTLIMLAVDAKLNPGVPMEVDNYHSLYPLEPVPEIPLQKSRLFGFFTSCYKAIKRNDGRPYCLRRIHGYRQVKEQSMAFVGMWKKVQHPHIVQLREVFTSKAFGEHSLIFAHDYHPGAETMTSRHFQNPNNNYASKAKWSGGTTRQNAGLLPESLIWTYVVQLTSALRCVHTAGLACRVLDPSKIIVTDKSRLRINGVGIFDVLRGDNFNSNPQVHMQQYQQEDMVALGKVVLALACNSTSAYKQENFQMCLDLVAKNYSADLKNLVVYLLPTQQRPLNVNGIMPMVGARFYTQLDAATFRGDVIENELTKELENGRLFRIISKLGTINERPEFTTDPRWSETGDRYLLKLFRDHVFHQVTDTGAPWVDLVHIVQCLNKLDAGIPEKICLMSRDERNVLVVSYTELNKAFKQCFADLVKSSSTT